MALVSFEDWGKEEPAKPAPAKVPPPEVSTTPQNTRRGAAPRPGLAALRDDTPPLEQPLTTVQSGVRGLAQGASAGFADEATAVLGTLLRMASSAKPNETMADTYRRIRDDYRQQDAKAYGENPASYTTGQMAGAVVSPVNKLPLNYVNQAAVAGLGNSGADLTKGEYARATDDAVKGGFLGYGLGKTATLASKAVGATLPKAGEALAGSTLGGVAGNAVALPATAIAGGLAGGVGGALGGAGLTAPVISKAIKATVDKSTSPTVQNAAAAYKAAAERLGPALRDQGPAAAQAMGRTVAERAGPVVSGPLSATQPAQDVLEWTRNKLGIDFDKQLKDIVQERLGANTPAAEQALPSDVRRGEQARADEAAGGERNGPVSRSGSQVINENGKKFLLLEDGRRIEVQ